MASTKSVIRAFIAFGEARQAAGLAQGAYAVAPACEYFMWVGLVPYIPDEFVFRGIENMMQRYGKLHHAKASAQMAARMGYGTNSFSPQLNGQLL